MRYDNVEEAEFRLRNTVILYDGKPVLCDHTHMGADGKLQLEIYELPAVNRKTLRTVPLDDPKLNMRNIPLGYVNLSSEAVYLTRTPARKYKQGVCAENVVVPANMQGFRWNTIYMKQGFTDSLSGKFPTYSEAKKMLLDNEELKSVAFSRTMALKRTNLGLFMLEYKGEEIAWSGDDTFVLPSHLSFLKEVAMLQGIKLA